ncbi:PAS domain S-box protein [bacterium]|nr:PAS domain S-box protein [bacterium]
MAERLLKDILVTNVISVPRETKLSEAIQLMGKEEISCLIISQNNKPLGIFTEKDALRVLHDGLSLERRIEGVMTSPILSAVLDMNIYQAHEMFEKHKIRHLVVVEESGSIAGVVTISDIINNLSAEYLLELKDISRLITRNVITCKKETLLSEAIKKMVELSISCIVVEEDKKPLGILTERDVTRLFHKRKQIKRLAIGKVMSQPVQTITLNVSVYDTTKRMGEKGIRRLVIVNEKEEICGIITQSDITKRLWEKYIEFLKEDIAKRMNAEDALRQSEEKYRFLVENVADVIWIRDLNLRFTYVSPYIERLRGYTVEEVMNQTLKDTLTPESYAVAMKVFAEEIEIEKQQEKNLQRWRTLELEQPCKNGSIIWTENRTTFLRDKDNKPIGILGITRDITAKKKAEDALRQSEEKYRLVVDNASEAILVIQNERIAFFNPKAKELSGHQDKELLTKRYLDFVFSDDRAMVNENHKKRLQGEDVPLYTFRWQTKDGKVRWTEVDGVLITWKGQPATLNFLTDITEKRKMEEELKRTDVSRLESIGLLAGGIAHDFNNILTAVLNNIALARMHTKEDRVNRMLADGERAVLRAKGLTQQLLTFAKGGEPIKKTICISELIRDIASFALTGSASVCSFHIPDNLWQTECDQGQISQAITNLILNADDAMPGGGVIEVSGENLIEEGHRFIKLSIKDSGIGIPKEHISKIFDPYFTTKQRGSGLGLSVAFSVIKKHGGRLEVTSELGEGSTFIIILPASERREKERQEVVARKGGRVLIMDDEPLVLEVTDELIRFFGYETALSTNGTEAVEMYKREKEAGKPFDVVILDLIVSGGVGGFECLKMLKGIDPEVTAIVSSGYSNDPIMSDFERYGFSGVLPKPYVPEEMSVVLDSVISK